MNGTFTCDLGVVEVSAQYEPGDRDLPAGYSDVCVESLDGVPFADLDEETQEAVFEATETAIWQGSIDFSDGDDGYDDGYYDNY